MGLGPLVLEALWTLLAACVLTAEVHRGPTTAEGARPMVAGVAAHQLLSALGMLPGGDDDELGPLGSALWPHQGSAESLWLWAAFAAAAVAAADALGGGGMGCTWARWAAGVCLGIAFADRMRPSHGVWGPRDLVGALLGSSSAAEDTEELGDGAAGWLTAAAAAAAVAAVALLCGAAAVWAARSRAAATPAERCIADGSLAPTVPVVAEERGRAAAAARVAAALALALVWARWAVAEYPAPGCSDIDAAQADWGPDQAFNYAAPLRQLPAPLRRVVRPASALSLPCLVLGTAAAVVIAAAAAGQRGGGAGVLTLCSAGAAAQLAVVQLRADPAGAGEHRVAPFWVAAGCGLVALLAHTLPNRVIPAGRGAACCFLILAAWLLWHAAGGRGHRQGPCPPPHWFHPSPMSILAPTFGMCCIPDEVLAVILSYEAAPRILACRTHTVSRQWRRCVLEPLRGYYRYLLGCASAVNTVRSAPALLPIPDAASPLPEGCEVNVAVMRCMRCAAVGIAEQTATGTTWGHCHACGNCGTLDFVSEIADAVSTRRPPCAD